MGQPGWETPSSVCFSDSLSKIQHNSCIVWILRIPTEGHLVKDWPQCCHCWKWWANDKSLRVTGHYGCSQGTMGPQFFPLFFLLHAVGWGGLLHYTLPLLGLFCHWPKATGRTIDCPLKSMPVETPASVNEDKPLLLNKLVTSSVCYNNRSSPAQEAYASF